MKVMCLGASYNKKSLKSLKKGVGSGVGSVSISQRYVSGDPDPDPQQNVTDPQHTASKAGGH
jgi:hypothetical protein